MVAAEEYAKAMVAFALDQANPERAATFYVWSRLHPYYVKRSPHKKTRSLTDANTLQERLEALLEETYTYPIERAAERHHHQHAIRRIMP